MIHRTKKKAIIYTRVSTDEQNNGYSPADQKDKLYRYCENNNIEVVGFFHDDASGKTFNRPKWNEIKAYLKKVKKEVDYIYFLKWDRFSRNAPEAYAEISKLGKLGVEARAIEQPLDFEIPEQKLMLALYLTAPEVDNDRRALNVLNGIRRAKKEGRWLGGCPKGYKNSRNEFNKPIIIPEGGEEEQMVKEVFREFSTGLYNIEELRKKFIKKGLKCSRSSFWQLLRNRGYIGQVFVSAYKTEPEMWVKGIHEPLINEDIFFKVQDYLEDRKRIGPAKVETLRDEFPLRGFLICARCGKILTASYSRGGQGTRYPYYHCANGCKERNKADIVNEVFATFLSEIKISQGVKAVFKRILREQLDGKFSGHEKENIRIQKDIEKNQQRLINARTLMLDGEISADEYKEIRSGIDQKSSRLSIEQARFNSQHHGVERKLNECIELLENLPKYYRSKDTATKQLIIRSIFPSKLIFDINRCRTQKVNKAVELIISNYRASDKSKNKKHTPFGVLSGGVVSPRIELGSNV